MRGGAHALFLIRTRQKQTGRDVHELRDRGYGDIDLQMQKDRGDAKETKVEDAKR
jgi:hypothetical protein